MRIWAVLIAALVAAPASAAELRDYCPERPGLDTPPCIIDAGHLSVETSIADWTLDRQAGTRTDTVLIGDTLLRLGVTSGTEVQLAWTPYGHVRTRDASGAGTMSGTGDVTIGFKASLLRPDGKGVSVALKPFITLPTGGDAIGSGTWSAGLVVPLNFDLGKGIAFIATPEIDAAPNQSRHGRHLAWGSAAGLQASLTASLSLSAEAQVIRDDDPSGHATQAIAELSLAWQRGPATQLDIGVVAGLNHQSPDLELIGGIARRF